MLHLFLDIIFQCQQLYVTFIFFRYYFTNVSSYMLHLFLDIILPKSAAISYIYF
jgi:hypothetical protein